MKNLWNQLLLLDQTALKKLILFSTESLPRLYCVDVREQNTVRILYHQARDSIRLGLIVKSTSVWPQGCSEIVLAKHKPSTTLCMTAVFTDSVFGSNSNWQVYLLGNLLKTFQNEKPCCTALTLTVLNQIFSAIFIMLKNLDVVAIYFL